LIITSPLARKFFIFFIILSSNSFYRIVFIPEGLLDLIEISTSALIVGLVILNRVYNPPGVLKKHFNTEIILILLSVLFSMFVAKHFHGQDFKTTFIAQRFMYFYAFYYLLHDLNMKPEELIRMMLAMGIIYVIFFMAQYFAYPERLFDVRIGEERGTLRIFLNGLGFMFFAYYFYLQRYLIAQKFKYGIAVIVFFLVGGLLQGTRQLLASMTLLTMAFIFFNRQVRSRIVVIFISVLAGISIFLILQDMIMELIELTQKEANEEKTNIRVLAMTYFLNDFMPSAWAYIFGNGVDSMNSLYGQKIHFLKIFKGFYQSDIGIIGDYTKFGVLFVIAQFSVFLRIIFGKLHPDLAFLRYLFIGLLITLFSGRNLMGTAGGSVFIVMILYIFDYYKNLNEDNQLVITEKPRLKSRPPARSRKNNFRKEK
jgi:hypothetical protein